MLRGAVGRQRHAVSKTAHLLVFSIGGRRLAVKTEEVGGIGEWTGSVSVPSRTPFVSAIIRRDRTVFPVFDLAGMLNVLVRGTQPLCLMAKHPMGAMAIRIDEDMPVLHQLDSGAIRGYHTREFETIGSFTDEFEEIPIISLARLATA